MKTINGAEPMIVWELAGDRTASPADSGMKDVEEL
jgi:hypothetical protein